MSGRDSIRDTSWTKAHSLIYLYLVLAHHPDSVFTKEEKEKMFELIRKRVGRTAEPFETVYGETVQKYQLDILSEEFEEPQAHLRACIESAEHYVEDAADRLEALKGLLEDLVAIGMADGIFHEDERRMVNDLSKHWGIDFTV